MSFGGIKLSGGIRHLAVGRGPAGRIVRDDAFGDRALDEGTFHSLAAAWMSICRAAAPPLRM